MNAIRKYPLPLNSGKECIILEGFGEKICQTIDKKLESFLADGGLNKFLMLLFFMEYSFNISNKGKLHNDSEENTSTDELKLSKKNAQSKSITERGTINQKRKCTTSVGKTDENSDQYPVSPVSKKTASGNREYKPEFRTGAYALLVALLKNEEVQN